MAKASQSFDRPKNFPKKGTSDTLYSMSEHVGFDAFASAGFGASMPPHGGGGVESGFDGPSLSNAQPRLYVREQDKRPTSTGQDAPPLPTSAPVIETTSDSSAARNAGVSFLWAALGAGVGGIFGGWWGAGAGLLGAGTVRNAMRARKLWGSQDALQREEASSSATMAALAGAGSAYLAYRAYKHQRLEE